MDTSGGEAVAVSQKVQQILRDYNDTPRVLFQTDHPLLLARHGGMKPVNLVCTRYYTYMIKVKGEKLYTRWMNRFLSVTSDGEKLHVDALGARSRSGGAGGVGGLGSMPPMLSSTGLGPTASNQYGSRAAVAPVSAEEAETDEFQSVELSAESSSAAKTIDDMLYRLCSSARRTAEMLARQEAGEDISLVSARRPSANAEDAEEDAQNADAASSGSDDENAAFAGAGRKAAAGGAMTAGAGGGRAGRREGDVADALLQLNPSRYVAITSLVDGEFADYSTLKSAYTRREEDDLMRDLALFIKDNEGQVEALCEHHYPAFIHAAQQCLSISEKDAQLVSQELSGASALVRNAVVDMKQVAAGLLVSRNARQNLYEVRRLLARATTLAECLETTESQVKRKQLLGAITSIRHLIQLATAMPEYALAEYVLHMRVPALTRDVFAHSVQQLNAWLQLLRDQATPIGQAALNWAGRVQPGSMTRRIIMAPGGNYWSLVEAFQSASVNFAAFEGAEAAVAISNGAGIQRVFAELRREDFLVRYYKEGRAQQAKSDIFDRTLTPPPGAPAEQSVADFQAFCATALGFILIEDLVYHATYPHLQSKAEVLRSWDRLSTKVGELAQQVSRTLATAVPAIDTNFTVLLLQNVRRLVTHAAENVKCVALNPLVLTRATETISDGLISTWLQQACTSVAESIMTDSLVPVSVDSETQFVSCVSRFHLNECPLLELPIPARYPTGVVMLPYSASTINLGAEALQFVQRCYSILSVDTSSAVRQSELNNVDEMVLKYITVLFRTASETMVGQLMSISPRSVLQFAIFISSCSVMPVLVSCVEQQFLLSWHGDFSSKGDQELGKPQLLAAAGKLFANPLQKGMPALQRAFMGEMDDRLKCTASYSYWKKHADIRHNRKQAPASSGDEGLAAAFDYALLLIPKLGAILQSTVVRSVVSIAMVNASMTVQSNVESAIKNAYQKDDERDFDEMRECMTEFLTQAATLIPTWQRRLGDMLPGLSAATRFPLNPQSVFDDLNAWLRPRETRHQAEKASQPQILAGIEGATKAVSKGFQAVGSVFKKD